MPAAAPAPACGRGLTGRRPLSAGRTSATAGSSQEPGGEMNKPFNDILDSMYLDITAAQYQDTKGKQTLCRNPPPPQLSVSECLVLSKNIIIKYPVCPLLACLLVPNNSD